MASLTVNTDRFAHEMVVDGTTHAQVEIDSVHPDANRYITELMNMSNDGGLFWPSGGLNRHSIIYALVISIWTVFGIYLDPEVVIEMIGCMQYSALVQWSGLDPTSNLPAPYWFDKNYIVPLQAALLLDLLAHRLGQRVNLGIVFPLEKGSHEHNLIVIQPPHSQPHHRIIWVYVTDPDLSQYEDAFYAGYVTSESMSRGALNLRPLQWNSPKTGVKIRAIKDKFPNIPFGQELLMIMRIWPGSNRSVRFWPSQVAQAAGEGDRTMVWHRMEAALRFHFGEDIFVQFREEWNQRHRDLTWSPAMYLELLLEFPID